MLPSKAPTPPDALPADITPQVVQGEIEDFHRSHERRRRQIPLAALVGVLAGLVAVAFRLTLDQGDALRNQLLAIGHRYPTFGFLLPVLFGAFGAGVATYLVRRVAPETSGSGIPHLKAVLHHLRGMRWQRVLPVKFVGGVAGIAGGLALGREGPTVQMGGAVGLAVGQWLAVTPRERRTLIAAGAGAGLAAAFNAPLAGVVFVLEEVQRDFTPGVFTAAFLSSVTADVLARLLLGQNPVFHVLVPNPPPLTALPAFAVLGVLAGLLSVLFNRALLGSLNLFQRTRTWPSWAPGALVGAAVGVVAWFQPDAVAGGHRLLERTFSAEEPLATLFGLFLLRFALTMFSYGTGAPGGIFAPLLVLGSQLGLAVGKVAGQVAPTAVGSPVGFAVVGMGAYFTGIVRAPLTGVVLILEMTGNYSLMLPLLLACLTAYGVADLLRDQPIYEALLERDLLRGRHEPELEETLLLELTVLPGAPFAGKRVAELGLPAGCLLVTVRHRLDDIVPTGDTRLQPGDRITAVIAPQAAGAAATLREGVEPAA